MATSIVSSTTTAANQLGMESLMKILMTQLTYQDPLKPMDNQQFMAQIAQFTALEQTQQINDNVTKLVSMQASLQTVGLIGKTVVVSSGSGNVSGSVTGIEFSSGTPLLSVKTSAGAVLSNVSFSQIVSVN